MTHTLVPARGRGRRQPPRWRLLLLSATALTGCLALSPGALADETIDGSSETVIGTGGGTQASPWNIAGNLTVGNTGTGTLTITEGGAVTNTQGYVGRQNGSNGTVTITGSGSTWTSTGLLLVGSSGTGALVVSNGGKVSTSAFYAGANSGSAATVTVSGAGSVLTAGDSYIGANGDATLTISDGGKVDFSSSSTFLYLGSGTGSGTATVTGAGSEWITGNDFRIGKGAGSGNTLTISDSGKVTSEFVAIGDGGTATATVTGTGSTWSIEGHMQAGRNSTGTLTIADGGTVSTASSAIGASAASNGTINVTGAGATWTNTNVIDIARYGTGTLTIADGGKVSAGGIVNIAEQTGSTGTLNIGAASGATAGAAGTLDAGTIAFGAGTGAIVFNHTNTDYVFGANVTAGSGTGTLDQLSGSTTLTGSVAVNGNTGVDGGSLTLSSGASLTNLEGRIGKSTGSTGAITVAGAGATWTNNDILSVGNYGRGTLTIAAGGKVSNTNGFIGLAATGTGSATVTGTGSTWTHNGLIDIGASGNGTLTVSAGGAVTSDGGNIAHYAGSSGTVTITGAGSSWTNLYDVLAGYNGDGAVTIAAGGAMTDRIGYLGVKAGATGTITVTGQGSRWTNTDSIRLGRAGTGVLTIADGGTVDVAGGSGTVTVTEDAAAAGTLNIGAAAGATAAAAGTLNARTVAFGPGTGTIVFNHTDTAYTFGVDVTGAGALKLYSGATSLTGNLAAFTGTIAVLGGKLSMNTTYGGTITIGSGGRFGGNGTIGAIVANAGSTVAPGNSIGTLNITGNAVFSPGATYEVEIDSAGNADRIAATGSATVTGATVKVVPYPDFATGTPYTILTAAGGVTGTFAGASFNSLFFTPVLTYRATDVQLTLAKTVTFASVAATPNQTAAAAGLESTGSGSVFDATANLGSATQAQAAYDSLSGEIHASAAGLFVDDSRIVRDTVTDRVRAAFAALAADKAPATSGRAAGVWAQAYGSWGRQDGDGNAASLLSRDGGLLLGADTALAGGWRAGVFGGYGATGFDAAARTASGQADAYHFGAYGGTQAGAWNLRFGAAQTWYDVSTSRTAAVGTLSETLTAGYWATTTQAFAETGYSFELGEARLEPFAALALVNAHNAAFAESGGAAALSVAAGSRTAGITTLGVRAETGQLRIGDWDVKLRGSLAWRHVVGDVTPETSMTLAGGNAFTIAGAPFARDTAIVEVGINGQLAQNATFDLGYHGEFSQSTAKQGFRAGLSLKF